MHECVSGPRGVGGRGKGFSLSKILAFTSQGYNCCRHRSSYCCAALNGISKHGPRPDPTQKKSETHTKNWYRIGINPTHPPAMPLGRCLSSVSSSREQSPQWDDYPACVPAVTPTPQPSPAPQSPPPPTACHPLPPSQCTPSQCIRCRGEPGEGWRVGRDGG